MVFVGLANSVFHPADYAVLSSKIAPDRLGRAFSIHTFAGFLGNAVAPVTIIALAAAVPLVVARGIDNEIMPLHPAHLGAHSVAGRGNGMTSILTPTILG